MRKHFLFPGVTGAFLLSFLLSFSVSGQFADHPYHFTDVRKVATTPVKAQDRTGTCWCFATTSFVETEILRMGGPELDLSEMFTVEHAYQHKAELYVRYHGLANFGPGGQAHDVMNMIRRYGMVPEEVYPGMHYGDTIHNHSELNRVLENYLKGVVKGGNLTTAWARGFAAVVHAYLGDEPEEFTYGGENYTPLTFRDHLKFNPDDYVELTSYTHHPFYERFDLEVPDNWSHDLYYNLPIDELMEVIDQALAHGYSVAWDGDVSERGFSHKHGVAVLPAIPWDRMTGEEKDSVFEHPVKQRVVTQEMRQKAFDDYATTDDHLMHLVGTARDARGTKYYLTKNSWGSDSNDYGGYLMMSEPYVRLETIAVMVHRDAIPKAIRKKLGL